MPHVPDDPDDHRAVVLRHQATDRIAAWPEPVCQVLVDDHDLRARGVAVVEVTSRPERNLHGLQVMLIDDPRKHGWSLAGRYATPTARIPHVRFRPSGSTSLNPTASTPRIVETFRTCHRGTAPHPPAFEGSRRIDTPGHRVLRLEPEIHLQQGREAAEQKARAHEEDTRQRDLGDDERVAGDDGAPARAALVRGLLGSMTARQVERREDAACNAGQRGEPDRHDERHGIDRRVLQERDANVCSRASALVAHIATGTPMTDPRTARSRLSARAWAIRCRRDAPMATRIANS